MKKIIFCLCLFLAACSKSGTVSVTNTSAANAAPTASASDGKIQLTWFAGTGSSDGYYVEQSTDGVNFAQIASVTATSFLVTGATRNQTYRFRVRAYNSGGVSPYSAIATVTP